MDCRQWPMPELRGLAHEHFDCIRNFINRQNWLMLKNWVWKPIGSNVFSLKSQHTYMDYKDLTNAPHDARAAATFVWEHISWMQPILIHFIEHIDSTFLAQNIWTTVVEKSLWMNLIYFVIFQHGHDHDISYSASHMRLWKHHSFLLDLSILFILPVKKIQRFARIILVKNETIARTRGKFSEDRK